MPEMIFLKAGSLDDASWIKPAAEVWIGSAHPWAPHFEGTVQMERGPQ
jgi:hypothetical protein